jgi:hypothetical protein
MSHLECPSCKLRIKAMGAPANCPRCKVRNGSLVALIPVPMFDPVSDPSTAKGEQSRARSQAH